MYEYPRSRCGLKPTSKQEITQTVTGRKIPWINMKDIKLKFEGTCTYDAASQLGSWRAFQIV